MINKFKKRRQKSKAEHSVLMIIDILSGMDRIQLKKVQDYVELIKTLK